MHLFPPSKPSPIMFLSEDELKELEEENERLRELVVTLQERVDALRNRIN
jgi:hypothetical protein